MAEQSDIHKYRTIMSVGSGGVGLALLLVLIIFPAIFYIWRSREFSVEALRENIRD